MPHDTPYLTTATRHILGEGAADGTQRCILCGVSVAAHVLGSLPAGEVFERDGRLFLIEPDEDTMSCLEHVK